MNALIKKFDAFNEELIKDPLPSTAGSAEKEMGVIETFKGQEGSGKETLAYKYLITEVEENANLTGFDVRIKMSVDVNLFGNKRVDEVRMEFVKTSQQFEMIAISKILKTHFFKVPVESGYMPTGEIGEIVHELMNDAMGEYLIHMVKTI